MYHHDDGDDLNRHIACDMC